MRPLPRLFAVPLILVATASSLPAADIVDNAGMFDAATIQSAQTKLDAAEKGSRIPIRIETIDSLRGESADDVSLRLARRWDKPGLFVLLDKKEHKIVVRDFKSFLGNEGRREVRSAFVDSFKKGDYNGGLTKASSTIGDVLETAAPPAVAPRGGVARRPVIGGLPPAQPAAKRSGLPMWMIVIGLLLLAWIAIRLIGSLFGGGNRYARPMGGGPGGMMGGGGPGYGGGGYGGAPGGGGFMSSLFGGIGGAMAGNWLYDQFSGRQHGGGAYPVDQTSYDPGPSPADDPATGAWGGGGESADWGGGGGDVGGGGGDWSGGGGGDGGGGGGDW